MTIFQFIKSKSFFKQIVFVGLAFLLFLFILFQWISITTNHDQKIQVPDLSKLTEIEATEVLSDVGLRLKVLDSTNYNPDFPPTSVLDQNPIAGDFVKEKRQIYVTLNPKGYRLIEIPTFYGKTKRNISAILQKTGFRVGDKPIYTADKAKDVVRGVLWKGEPIKEGAKIPKNALLQLKLGDGKLSLDYKNEQEQNSPKETEEL